MDLTPDPQRVISIILGGGAGTRLFPLTQERAKPAVPLAGKYRLVDIPISLCINSGIKRIFLLTQYLSSSLHRHVQQAYRFDSFHPRGFVEILAATQTRDAFAWYQGTADAVRQNLQHFRNHDHDIVLILSGDQLYRMDYRKVLAQHMSTGADVTVATIPVSREPARSFGIMQLDENKKVTRFVEKPKEDQLLDTLGIDPAIRQELDYQGNDDLFLASMGIYVFNRDTLEEALSKEKHEDFGKHIIPSLIQSRNVYSYIYEGYWEDIGTIRAFYEANLDLTENIPKFNLYDTESPIYSRFRNLPPSKVKGSEIDKSIVADGCFIEGAKIDHTLVGLRSRIGGGCTIADSIIMGADYYEDVEDLQSNDDKGIPHVGIGHDTSIQGAIIDKNARIGKNVTITAKDKEHDIDSDLYYVRDGIVIIPKGSIVPDGTVI